MSQITYSQIEKIKNLEFDSYLKIKGHSHSSLKQMENGLQKEFFATDKVRVGKIVDDILTNKGLETIISNPLYPAAKDIASRIKAELGESLLSKMTPQISYQAIMEFEGMKIQIKGRPDEELGNIAVIDFKVNNSCKSLQDCENLIMYMGYDNQLYNYGRLGLKKNHFLFIYSTVVKKTFFLKRLKTQLDIDLAENWWINKILEFGMV